MESHVNLLFISIFICACIYYFLTFQAWQSKKANLNRFQKLLVLNGWWVFNSAYLNNGSENLIKKGRVIFYIMFTLIITTMVITSSSNRI